MHIILKRAITLSGSRLLALSMPLLDFVILGYFYHTEIALHTLATQLIQIAIVILVTSAGGINFIAGKANVNKQAVACFCFGHLFYIGMTALLLFSLVGMLVYDGILAEIIAILSIGIPFTACYVANAAILESNGHESKIFNVSIITAILNVVISLLLVFSFPHPAMMVAIGTTMIRVMQLIISIYYIKTRLGFYVKPLTNRSVSRELFNLSVSDVVTSLAFIVSIYAALIFIERRFDDSAVASLGIALSHMNIISVVCISFSISYIIYNSNVNHLAIRIEKSSVRLAGCFFFLLLVLLVMVNPWFARIYNLSGSIENLDNYLLYAIAVVIADGIAMFINSHLRTYGFKILPPLFRLAFVIVGIPLGGILSVYFKQAEFLVVGMVIGNLLSLILSFSYYYHKLSTVTVRDLAG